MVRAGRLETLWTDRRDLPSTGPPLWWECWCWKGRVNYLLIATRHMQLRASEQRLHFPEFEVVPVFASLEQMRRLIQNTDAIEELRLAEDSPTFFTSTVRREQSLWVEELSQRIIAPPKDAPVVCILDNGINQRHPLLLSALQASDCLAVVEAWGVDDHDKGGHGTNMAGAVLYADLTAPLSDLRTLPLEFHLESVKFIPPPGFVPTDPANYGSITQSAVSLAEIHQPGRSRVYCMAVTNLDLSGERPTSWSSAVDQLCAGGMPGEIEDEDELLRGRLFFVSAGNVPDQSDPDLISDSDEFPIEDPAQAWNAVTVGGFTDKATVTDAQYQGWSATGEVGDHSPYSRISTDWNQSRAPIKPEVVFEAGNRALSPEKKEVLAGLPSLSLLTTAREFQKQPLATFWATSPATAQAAGMAATILASYPDFWPETVRALMVHSAEWTPAMRQRLKACKNKKQSIALARQFGYGVPRLERALASAENDLALISQAEIQPFKRERKRDEKGNWLPPTTNFNEIHYYALPWPKQELEKLAEKNVTLKVTLSYFVEPSPGNVAPVDPERYQSFGLRYALKRPNDEQFRCRVNQLERGDDELSKAANDTRWTFGSQSAAAGSIHCDTWVGPAIELAARDVLAIYPVAGWWKSRPKLGRANFKARYALIVSLTSDDLDVKLHTEISNLVRVKTEVSV